MAMVVLVLPLPPLMVVINRYFELVATELCLELEGMPRVRLMVLVLLLISWAKVSNLICSNCYWIRIWKGIWRGLCNLIN